jgi:hypothetical protein
MTPGGLTDDALTEERRPQSPPAYLRDAVDRLAGADPGPTQLRMALQSVLGIALVWLFIRLTRALQLQDEAIGQRRSGAAAEAFIPAVALNAAFLPGSVPVSAAASTTPGRGGLLDQATMPPYVRSAIQIAGVAAARGANSTRRWWRPRRRCGGPRSAATPRG